MPLMNAYLITTKNLNDFLNALVGAQAPEKFTQKFLEQLEFKSTNDRLFIGMLKGLSFIDEGGTPTQRYYDFLDQTQSGIILAEAIKEAYSDLFTVNKKANDLTAEDAKNKLKTLTQGQKSEKVISLMANTFRALCDYADWTKTRASQEQPKVQTSEEYKEDTPDLPKKFSLYHPQLHYNIQIHLPESRDPAVYDALFRSLKEHLLEGPTK
jgi:hypothetical protein